MRVVISSIEIAGIIACVASVEEESEVNLAFHSTCTDFAVFSRKTIMIESICKRQKNDY